MLLLLQVIPKKINYNYFTLYKASSLKTWNNSIKKGLLALSSFFFLTAVDSDVGYDGTEFNSVCCKYSQSLENVFIQYR